MNVRKRGLALLMCICMIFTLLPFSAFADGEESYNTHSETGGVVMDKTVTHVSDDTYKVTLEQYVSGSVTPGTTTPIDAVLVLDVSGSMDEGFGEGDAAYVEEYNPEKNSNYTYYIKDANGSYTGVSWCSKCKEFTDGCTWFFGHVAGKKYTPMTSAEDIASDHVQFFSSNTKITALKSAVNSFIDVIAEDNPTSKIAIVKFAGDKKDTVGNDTYKEGRYTYNYTQIVQNLTEANTDGAASLKAAVNALTASGATAADYGLEKAIDVFGAAGQVPKDRNRVVIMFTDGEPNYDNGFDGRVAKAAIDKAKTLKNESYGASVYTIGIFDGASVGESLPANNDNGRTNRYMHLVSSNYPEASSMKDTGTGDVTKGFYKVASDANSLGSVFTQLGEAIGKPSIDLGSTAVLTDNIASNFIAPANVADVKVYTADYDGNSKTFGDWEDFPGDVKISGNAVTVTGFNYSANYVSETQHPGTDNDFGKKLIVEFKITVDRTKTYGGTQPANAGANITLDGETIASVGNPQVPVSIVNGFSASYTNSKTYDGNGFTIKDEFEAMLKKDNIADGEKNDYVNITYTVIDEKGGIVGTYVIEANKTTGTWTAGSAAAITSPDVGTYNYKVTCVVSDVNKENGAASVEASGTMTLSIAANTGLIVSGNNYTGKYDGASHGEAATANVDGATIEYSTDNGATWTDTVPTIKDVGEINVTVKASMANYSDATATYTLKVTPRTVTLTSETASKPYDGDPLTRPVVTIGGDGFVDGEVTDIKAIGSVTNVSDSPVTNTIVYTTTDEFVEDNYNITKDEGTLTITKSGELSVNAKGYDGKYDGQTHNGNVTATEGATLSYSTDGGNTWIATEPTIKNVGEINVTVKASMANYSDATATYTLKVTPRTVTLTSETASKTYDGTPLTRPVVTVTGDGFVDGEVTDIKATGSVTNVSEGSVTNTIVYTTTDKFVEDNYNITKAEGKLSITPLAVTVTAKDYTKYVGEKDPAFEATVTGTINNDTVSYTISREKGETAGTYSITPAGAEAQGNYTVTYNAGTLTINRRPYIPPVNPPITDKITVEITGNSDSVVYDGTEHSVKDYTVKISDSRYTEKDFTFSGKALASGVNAGAYEMGLKADQFKNTNARFTNVEFIIKADGVLTITQRPLTITAGSAEGIAPVTCDKYTVEGLATGDKVDSVKITGIQSEPGESPNVASDAVIKNAKGEDVTANYKITYVDGVLKAIEVLNKEIHFNYVIGYTDGTIRPNNDISRAEVATIFFRLLTDEARTQYDKTTSSFSDIKDGAWCCRAVSTLTNMGIIKGYTDGSFQPNKSITRAELATIIARFAKLDVNTKTFSDINGHWAQKSIELAAGNGWINGYTDGTFRPNKSIIRAETFAMINRVLDRQTESVSDLLPTSEMNMWSDNLNENAWYYKDVQEATNYHKCDRVGDSVYEKWTEKVPDIDWASYQI
ncbi:MAG: S-layer homology domain-containing protein [Oscillospiraceae bacterium]|nr:S-layer homology domain-containing protein [Oscillospiraceae bacterium]